MYAYRAYLETELNYNWGCKNSFMEASGYNKDHPASKVNSAENVGIVNRMAEYKGSSVVELTAPLHCDLFLTDRLLVNKTQLHLELHRNNDPFALMCIGDDCPTKSGI